VTHRVLSNLQNIHTESTYILVTNNSLSRLCFTCVSPLIPLINPDQQFTASLSESNNLQLRKIDCPKIFFYHYLPGPTECNRLGMYFRGEGRLCSVLAISSKMNFTPYDSSTDFSSHSHLMITSAQFSLHLIESNPNERYSWLPYGQIVEPVTFVLIMKHPRRLQLDQILSPFSLLTWIIFALSLSLLTVVGILLSSFPRQDIILMLLGTLFEQSPAYFIQQYNIYHGATRVLLGFWLISSIVLIGAYKGRFYSSLTKTSLPHLPQTLRDLVSSNKFQLYSADSIFSQETFSYEYVLETLIDEFRSGTSLAMFPGKVSIYESLLNKITFFQGLTYSQIRAMAELKMPIFNGFTSHDSDIVVGDSWAVITTPSGIDHFLKVMQPLQCGSGT